MYDYVGKGFVAGMNGATSVYSRFTKQISYLLPIGAHYDERLRVNGSDVDQNGKAFVLMLEYFDMNSTQTPTDCYALYDGQYVSMNVYLSNSPHDGGTYQNETGFYDKNSFNVMFKQNYDPPTQCMPYAFICKTSQNNFFRLPEEADYYFGTEWIDWSWSNYSEWQGLDCKENHYYYDGTEWLVNGGPTLSKSDIWYYRNTENYASCIGCQHIEILDCWSDCILSDFDDGHCDCDEHDDTQSPTAQTNDPTPGPTRGATIDPTNSPSNEPSANPTLQPSIRVSSGCVVGNECHCRLRAEPCNLDSPDICEWDYDQMVCESKTLSPSKDPTDNPSNDPTFDPTIHPTQIPTTSPTLKPTENPTSEPSKNPSKAPTFKPSHNPIPEPTPNPSPAPPNRPTLPPTEAPIDAPTEMPSTEPTELPTSIPTNSPIPEPSESPSPNPTISPIDDSVKPIGCITGKECPCRLFPEPCNLDLPDICQWDYDSNICASKTMNPSENPTLAPTRKPTKRAKVKPIDISRPSRIWWHKDSVEDDDMFKSSSSSSFHSSSSSSFRDLSASSSSDSDADQYRVDRLQW